MFNNQDSILSLMQIIGGDSSRMRPLCRLPPGSRFNPAEEELLSHYLTGKNSSIAVDPADVYGYDLIRELNLYDYTPSDLPEGACFVHGYQGRKRHWFCYTENRGGAERRANGGFWRQMGKVRAIFDEKDVVVGTRTEFVFYEVNSIKAEVGTPWIMYEYALLQHLQASFVLCRVFAKSHAAGNNNVSESVSARPEVGIQLNISPTPNILEAEINVDDFTRELDDPTATGPVTVASFEFLLGIPPDRPNNMMMWSFLKLNKFFSVVAVMQVGSWLTTNELLPSIVEGDFIEMEDFEQ